jgi:thiol:disulfide interchange protein
MAYDSSMSHSIFGARMGTRLVGRALIACALVAAAACDKAFPETSAAPAAAAASAPAVTVPEKPVIEAQKPVADVPQVQQPVAETKPDATREPVAKPVATQEAPKEIAWFQGTLDEALAKARKENKLVFIDFWTTWCGWCKKLDKDTYTDARVIAAMNEHYVCLSLDAETKVGAPLARRYSVDGYPTLLMLTTDGFVRERIAGYKAPDPFLKIVVAATKPR